MLHLHWAYFSFCHSHWKVTVIMSEIVMRAPGCKLWVSVRASPARLHFSQNDDALASFAQNDDAHQGGLHAPKPVSSGSALRLHPHKNALALLYASCIIVQCAVVRMPISGRERGWMCPYRWPTIPTCIAKHPHCKALRCNVAVFLRIITNHTSYLSFFLHGHNLGLNFSPHKGA